MWMRVLLCSSISHPVHQVHWCANAKNKKQNKMFSRHFGKTLRRCISKGLRSSRSSWCSASWIRTFLKTSSGLFRASKQYLQYWRGLFQLWYDMASFLTGINGWRVRLHPYCWRNKHMTSCQDSETDGQKWCRKIVVKGWFRSLFQKWTVPNIVLLYQFTGSRIFSLSPFPKPKPPSGLCFSFFVHAWEMAARQNLWRVPSRD